MSLLTLFGISQGFILFIQFMLYGFLTISSVLLFTYIGTLSDRLLMKMIGNKGAVIFLSGVIAGFITIIYFLIGKAFLFSWIFWILMLILLIGLGYIVWITNKFRFKKR